MHNTYSLFIVRFINKLLLHTMNVFFSLKRKNFKEVLLVTFFRGVGVLAVNHFFIAFARL